MSRPPSPRWTRPSATHPLLHLGSILAAILLVILAMGCSDSRAGGSRLPSIASFRANQQTGQVSITRGDSVTLDYGFQNGSGSIDQGVGTVTSGSTRVVTPDVSTLYALTVTGPGATQVVRTVLVKVVAAPGAPVVSSPATVTVHQTGLVATVTAQAGCSYAWTLTGNGTLTGAADGETVSFSAGAAGSLVLQCVASNAAGRASAPTRVTIAVQASTITDFRAHPAIITAGATTRLEATFTGGTGRITPGDLPIASGGSVQVSPAASTAYTLTVRDGGTVGAAMQVVVAVLPALADSAITAPASVLAHQGGCLASVPVQNGVNYAWQVTGGTLDAGQGTAEITFSAGAAGSVDLVCALSNPAGASIRVGRSVPIRAGGALAITLPRPVVAASQSGLLALLDPIAGARYQWTVPGGQILSGGNGTVLTFQAPAGAGSTDLSCTATLADGRVLTGSATLITTLPAIQLFAPLQAVVTEGEEALLEAVFSAGTGVLSPGDLEVASGSAPPVVPGSYTLTVTDAAGNQVQRGCVITSVPAPSITSFSAQSPIVGAGGSTALTGVFDPGPGGSATIEYGLGQAQSGVALDSGPLDTRTDFILTVTNAAGRRVVQLATVRVASLRVLSGVPWGQGNGDGTGPYARFDGCAGLAMDAERNLYVADTRNNLIRRVSATGVVTTLAGSGAAGLLDGPAAQAAFSAPRGVAVDAGGRVYVADTGNNAVRMITAEGAVLTLGGLPDGSAGSADGAGGPLSFNQPVGIAVNGAGTRLYVADSRNYTIRVLDPTQPVLTSAILAGQTGVSDHVDSGAGVAAFRLPYGIALAADGSLMVADSGSMTIRKVAVDGTVLTVAGQDGLSSPFTDGPGLDGATFNEPHWLAVNSDGDVYVTDAHQPVIRRLVPVAGTGPVEYRVDTFAGTPNSYGNQDGPPVAGAQFQAPAGLVADAYGNVLVADQAGHLLRIVPAVGPTGTLAGSQDGAGSTDGALADARFHEPRGMALDRAGMLYVADSENHAIRRISPDGGVSTLAGSAAVSGSADGTGAAASFTTPTAVVSDGTRYLYVADLGDNTIRRVDGTDGSVITLAGVAGHSGHLDGPGAGALFDSPAGLALDGAGNLYVADSLNHCVRRIDPAGQVTTMAGDPERDGYEDGGPGVGALGQPVGLALDGAGHLLIADFAFDLIRRMDLADGTLHTLAGTPGGGYLDGTGAAARFAGPVLMTLDTLGYLVLPEIGNNALRLVTSTGVVRTGVGIPGRRGVAPGPLPAALAEPVAVVVDPLSGDYYISTRDAILRLVFQ